MKFSSSKQNNLQSALHIYGFCIYTFNQPQIENIWEEKKKQKVLKNKICICFIQATIYIVFTLYYK